MKTRFQEWQDKQDRIWREGAPERNRRLLERFMGDPRLKMLHDSGELERVVKMLGGKDRYGHDRDHPLENVILGAVFTALADPDVAETMTASERRKLAQKIVDHSEGLLEALKPFMDDQRGFKWPFQPYFDRLALDVAISEEERLSEAGNPMDLETSHRCRYAVYHLLMDKIEWLFDAIESAAEHFDESETIIKKPNDPNAARLYFIRVLTRKFLYIFRSPCRAATLALASVYFDCNDLDEAAISKLAPRHKVLPRSVQISIEEYKAMRERYAAAGGDVQELDEAAGVVGRPELKGENSTSDSAE